MATKGLGRGLAALLSPGGTSSDATEEKREGRITMLSIQSIEPNPRQPRKEIPQESLKELSQSIRTYGILQPLLVRRKEISGQYELVAGERRWRAAQIAKLTEVPACIRNFSDSDVMIIALIENLQREDLNIVEEALAFKEIREKLNLTQQELATQLGKSKAHIANTLRLLDLPSEAIEALKNGQISAGHARTLLTLCDEPVAVKLFLAHIVSDALSVRDCEAIALAWKESKELPWKEEEKSSEEASLNTPSSRKKPKEIRSLEKSISKLLGCKTLLSGTSECGRISIHYTSEEELKNILKLLQCPSKETSEESPKEPSEEIQEEEK